MTTERDVVAVVQRLAPRGSIVRYGLAGGFNSAVFFISWTVSMLLLPQIDVRILWGFFWGVTGILAHFIHRFFTFDNHKSVAWTLPMSIPVYIGSLVGSSLTIGWLSTRFPTHMYWLGLVNLLAWGVLIWFTMRTLVFQFSAVTKHESPEYQGE
jgi:hypothetical protein